MTQLKVNVGLALQDYLNAQIKLGNAINDYLRETIQTDWHGEIGICTTPIQIDGHIRSYVTDLFVRKADGQLLAQDSNGSDWSMRDLNIQSIIEIYNSFNDTIADLTQKK